MEANETDRQLLAPKSDHDAEALGAKAYNTVFERILARTEGENALPIVIACVAYYHYKREKRDWLVEQKNRGPVDQAALDAYVRTCNDRRIESFIALARQEVQEFGSGMYDSIIDDVTDQIYKEQFEKLHQLIDQRGKDGASRHAALQGHISNSTKSRWFTAIGQNLVASLIWTAIIVIILASLHFNIDFGAVSKKLDGASQPDKPAAVMQPDKTK